MTSVFAVLQTTAVRFCSWQQQKVCGPLGDGMGGPRAKNGIAVLLRKQPRVLCRMLSIDILLETTFWRKMREVSMHGSPAAGDLHQRESLKH
jgi:hypothetical protein